ncbi:Alpha/Beta hydrolase protein [Paraphoma chrysanthemicola]|uniref:Alpha/Beta hydrolase protein n=1 Tax=Paraphoma chrysanthemicola TaxID=798071 RepID=A0A8K0W2U5_9PLEO|nr:Alpha/Beta hydrolase protein [Paraphoma chrysanthemicola]
MRPTTLLTAIFAGVSSAATVIPPSTWNYSYPWPVQYHQISSQQLNLSMAYMDVAPTNTTSRKNNTIVLLHGKNFCGATWEDSAKRLSAWGYRVIIPDQVGFCKSSKPPGYQFSLQQLAYNTQSLLQSLGLVRVKVLGHSMGGMLASRFALMYPNTTSHLVLTNPIGLEDWKALGVPYRPIDSIYKDELATTYTSIRNYQQITYYVNTWKNEYDTWVNMLLSLYKLPGESALFAYNMAQTTEAILNQPVVYEFPLIKARTLLIIGTKDNTAIGKAWSPPDVQKKLGNYTVLGRATAKAIRGAALVEFEDMGHSPQIQDSERYHKALFSWLDKSDW